ncbi:GerAB/ArcD/ProY family transporter [Paenibacillus methanolicus]|uniref:Spore germination protein n=1 Tax=Paenibacillus methanolicus TaxID=582686 RepID=A0A5S5BZQ5_9BACL|nr:endospore germination permease [Paenibacillus methanolicus]TYP72429.1 spore germination protein [Paenibacillus methanolicus]
MNHWEYDDNKIEAKELTITVSSMIIGVGILTLPRVLAGTTSSSDGWISILMAGAFAVTIAVLLGKFAGLYAGGTFFEYVRSLVTKPVAIVITGIMCVYFMLFLAYEIRAIANISKTYLFDRTPAEYIGLMFLLIVGYAASGTRIGLLRLNTMFFPIVLVVTFLLLFFSNSIVNWADLKPFFVTDVKRLMVGAKDSVFSMLGFEVILFYTAMMKRPKEAPLAAAVGVVIPVVLYVLIYLICIGTFTPWALQEIGYPAIELAKEVKIPGEFFERTESIFFTIWIMTIFNTASMALDIAVHLAHSIVRKGKRIHFVAAICPVAYLICMLPKNVIEFALLGEVISYMGFLTIGMTLCLYGVAAVKGMIK